MSTRGTAEGKLGVSGALGRAQMPVFDASRLTGPQGPRGGMSGLGLGMWRGGTRGGSSKKRGLGGW